MKRLKYGVSLSQRNRRKRISPYFHKDIAVLKIMYNKLRKLENA